MHKERVKHGSCTQTLAQDFLQPKFPPLGWKMGIPLSTAMGIPPPFCFSSFLRPWAFPMGMPMDMQNLIVSGAAVLTNPFFLSSIHLAESIQSRRGRSRATHTARTRTHTHTHTQGGQLAPNGSEMEHLATLGATSNGTQGARANAQRATGSQRQDTGRNAQRVSGMLPTCGPPRL